MRELKGMMGNWKIILCSLADSESGSDIADNILLNTSWFHRESDNDNDNENATTTIQVTTDSTTTRTTATTRAQDVYDSK